MRDSRLRHRSWCGELEDRRGAWSTPSTRTTGTLITAAIWNQDVVDNPIALRAGGIALASQAIGDLPYASSTTQFGRIPAVAVGHVLASAGVGTIPAWTPTPSVSTITTTAAGSVFSSGAAQFGAGIAVSASTHATSRRASITLGDCQVGQDSAGNGTKDLYLAEPTGKGIVIAPTTGVITFNAYTGTTFVAGDKYLVVNASGAIHVSALGPAS